MKTNLKQFLVDNPELCHMLLQNPILFTGSGYDVGRMLTSFTQDGYKVSVEVDDDELTPEQRKRRDADLADKVIKLLMTQRGKER